jgi:phosphoribosylaminoimidazole-succinocarboxamide synthase
MANRPTVSTAGDIDSSAVSLTTNVVPQSTTATASAEIGADLLPMPHYRTPVAGTGRPLGWRGQFGMSTLGSTVQLIHSGKVRDVYRDGDDLLLVASDRVSVYDVVLPTPIPDKGIILTELSLWWFDRLQDIVPNHVISSTDVPPEFARRAIRCQRLDMIQVECIARGYLAGLGLKEYEAYGSVCGIPLPPGLVEGSKLPHPIFTPTTKAPGGQHDEFITFADVVDQVGEETAGRLRDLTIGVYQRGAQIAAASGVIVADTKLEFGWTPDHVLTLADEVLTPDSSRFWPAEEWQPGRSQFAFDKQVVRDWATGTGWDKKPPAPEVPAQVVAVTRGRYIEALEKITGQSWLNEDSSADRRVG